jgi:aminopeptidase N
MDEERVLDELRQCLTQIAAELEEAATGARNAAGCLHDRAAAWAQVQQLFARLDQANHFIKRFQNAIEDATKPRQA